MIVMAVAVAAAVVAVVADVISIFTSPESGVSHADLASASTLAVLFCLMAAGSVIRRRSGSDRAKSTIYRPKNVMKREFIKMLAPVVAVIGAALWGWFLMDGPRDLTAGAPLVFALLSALFATIVVIVDSWWRDRQDRPDHPDRPEHPRH